MTTQVTYRVREANKRKEALLPEQAFGGYDALFAKLDENDQPLIREGLRSERA